VVLTDLSIFLDSWLSISVVSSSRICSFVFFSCWFFLFADRSVHGSLLPRALNFCRPCLAVGLQSPVESFSSRCRHPTPRFSLDFYGAVLLLPPRFQRGARQIRHPHRSSPVVIFCSRAPASCLVGVFIPKQLSRSEQAHHAREQHKQS
jgi:hypothetical protein